MQTCSCKKTFESVLLHYVKHISCLCEKWYVAWYNKGKNLDQISYIYFIYLSNQRMTYRYFFWDKCIL